MNVVESTSSGWKPKPPLHVARVHGEEERRDEGDRQAPAHPANDPEAEEYCSRRGADRAQVIAAP